MNARNLRLRSGTQHGRRCHTLEVLETRVVLASTPIISEFQASNQSTIRDEDGDSSDWIEITNPTDQTINLKDWYLTDDARDLTKWQFPAVSVNPGRQLVVFASNKDRAQPNSELHTNFRLSASGEYLALVQPNGFAPASEFTPEYPPQIVDQSYGELTNSQIQTYFRKPTPGSRNDMPAATEPVIENPGTTFVDNISVRLSIPDSDSGLEIRYTLNGGTPSTNSNLYKGPIRISSTTSLKAVVFDRKGTPTRAASNVAAATYLKVSSDLRNRTSDLPLLVIDTQGKSIPETRSSSQASAYVTIIDVDPATGRSRMVDGNVDYSGRGGLRDRGSSTGNQPKQSYAFETWGQSGDDVAVSLLGMPAESDWVLFAPYNFDRALIRNPFIYELSNQIGRYAPRTRFVEVYANQGGGSVSESDYVGVYVLIEKIKRDKNRVDIEPLDRDDNREPAVTGGYIFKIDRHDPGEAPFGAAGQTINFVQPDSNTVSSAQRTWATRYLNDFHSALNGNNFRDPNRGYAKFIDAPSWIDHHLLNVLSMNVDALRLSGYFYVDRRGKIEMGPIWDFDRSMESFDGRDDNPNVWRGGGDATDFFNYPWWKRLFDDPDFWQAYVDRWHELRRDQFSDANLDAIIDSMAAQLQESQSRNFNRWKDVRPRFGSWTGEVENMRDWLHKRASFIDAQFASTPTFVMNGQPLRTDVSGVNTSSNQRIQISPPGQESSADAAIISGQAGKTTGRYLVPTNDSLGTEWTSAGFNDSSWKTGASGFGYENSPSDYKDLIKTRIKPQDTNGNATTFYVRIQFGVDNPSTINRLVLRMRYDDGFVAYINGQEVARKGFSGTPRWNSGASDHHDSLAVVFEEFDVSSALGRLRNDGKNVLAIHAINSGTGSSDQLIVPELISRQVEFVAGGKGKIYYTTDGSDPRSPGGGVNSTARELPRSQSLVIDRNQRVIARNLDTSDRGSQSRIVDTDWSAPVTYNFVTEVPQLVISEINYHPADPYSAERQKLSNPSDDDFEFIEIKNVGNKTAQLAGVQLTDGVNFDFTTSGTTSLGPGEHAVLVKNEPAFAARYGNGVRVAGTFSGSLDNGGEDVDLVDGTGKILFSVNYDDADPWPRLADGFGGTLELKNPSDRTAETQSKHYRWQDSARFGGTPGTDSITAPGVVINEVLAHTDPPLTLSDSIELFNRSGSTVDISGWFLSDSRSNLRKYRIPDGTRLNSGEYIVFDESDFNPTPSNPSENHFALSGAKGDDVWLTIVDGSGRITTVVDGVQFSATANGESVGRSPNGTGRLTPMSVATLGGNNAAPRVGPVVVSEINYRPTSPSSSALDRYSSMRPSDLEYIEIHNPTSSSIDLADWRVRGGVDFDFGDAGQLAAGETVVLIPFNPAKPENADRLAAFRVHYGINDSVRLLGGLRGRLNNADDLIKLHRPDDPPLDDPTFSPPLLEDEVLYDDLAPWPTAADGSGRTLHRVRAGQLGNDPANWSAADPSPGTVDFSRAKVAGDLNLDNRVDVKDVDLICSEIRQGAFDSLYDLNGDGRITNDDLTVLIHSLIGTTFGDANLDRVFDSSDVVAVFASGQFEDALPLNSSWATGDWNCDGEFDSSDVVVAFQDGGYVAVSKASARNAGREQISSDVASAMQAEKTKPWRRLHDRLPSLPSND